MKISGSNELAASVDQVWEAMLDPAVLARCIPGCESLSTTGEHSYAMTVTAGVAAIKGTYQGAVSLADLEEPSSLTMKATGAGGPGTIDADVKVRLAPSASGGTTLTYDADAAVGGAIGGVGQRMLAGVTKKMAGQFFTALDRDIAGERPAAAVAAAAGPATGGGAVAGAATGDGAGAVYAGRAASPVGGGGGSRKDFALGVLTGGGMALLGVLIGWAIGRS